MVPTKHKDILSVTCILISVIIYFFPLFYPKPSIIFTPEIYDSYHLSYSQKFLLWESLQKNTLPLWSQKIGNGFPVLGEGQTGIFYLPNLFFFKFFDHFTAYNLSIVFSIFLVGLGMYYYLRLIRINPLLSLVGSLSLMYSGLYMTRLSHLTLLQGFSLLPLIIALTYVSIHTPSYKNVVILAFAMSQQFFAGFPQASFITILYAGSLVIWQRKTHAKVIFFYLLTLVLTLGLSAIQLFPSIEFLRQTITPASFLSDSYSQFTYSLKDILTFLYPYLSGNPLDGTYTFSFPGTLRFFWENNAYVGALFLIGLCFVLWVKIRDKSDRLFRQYLVMMLLLSFLFMLGKDSPFAFILAFWPFNLFRVASRFLFVFTHILIVINIYVTHTSLQKVDKKWIRVVLFTFFTVNFLHLFTIWSPIQIRIPKSKWLEKPEFTKYITDEFSVKQLYTNSLYRQLFIDKKPWKQKEGTYLFLKNTLNPDSNVLWNIKSDSAYPSRILLSTARMEDLLSAGLKETDKELEVKPLANKIIDISGIGYLVSVKPIQSTDLQLLTTATYEKNTLYLYKNLSPNPRIYFANTIYLANTLEKIKLLLEKENTFVPGKSAIINSFSDTIIPSRNTIETVESSEQSLTLQVHSENDGVLIISDTYYHGWMATIDNVPTNIYQANINQRAVKIMRGDHTVQFVYKPLSVRYGIAVSSISLLSCICLFISSLSLKGKRQV